MIMIKFKENIYKTDNEIIQLSQEICPDKCKDNKSCGTCYILQDNNIIMYNRDPSLYDSGNHSFF